MIEDISYLFGCYNPQMDVIDFFFSEESDLFRFKAICRFSADDLTQKVQMVDVEETRWMVVLLGIVQMEKLYRLCCESRFFADFPDYSFTW